MQFRTHIIILASALLGTAAAAAQDQTGSDPGGSPCVEVQIGEDVASHLNCVNAALLRQVEREHNTPLPQAPIDARSASNQVGTFNDAAAREKMGAAYGISAVPQRPKLIFTSPLLPSSH